MAIATSVSDLAVRQQVDLAPAPSDLNVAPPAIAPCLSGGSIIHLDGDPGDQIFAGIQTITVLNWARVVSLPTTFAYQASGPNYSWYWTIQFSSEQLGSPLMVQRYDNAERFSFEDPGHPGLDINGNGAACNTESGWFEIESMSIASDGSFNELTATFAQQCDGASPVLRGCVHYEAQ